MTLVLMLIVQMCSKLSERSDLGKWVGGVGRFISD